MVGEREGALKRPPGDIYVWWWWWTLVVHHNTHTHTLVNVYASNRSYVEHSGFHSAQKPEGHSVVTRIFGGLLLITFGLHLFPLGILHHALSPVYTGG